ncbi:hypothetical protein IV599_001149 [Salmonella enterica]|nr:hypothetical protein [Salmonella enterica]EHE6194726.1 hypothetical protein [Salmonella enterica]
MNDTERLYADFLQIMNEKFKSELLNIFPETHAAANAIQSDPYGRITSETLDIVTSALPSTSGTETCIVHIERGRNGYVPVSTSTFVDA